MSKKTIVNIVYSPQKGPPHKIYENNKGEIWHSAIYDKNKINVGMGWYSIPKPIQQDSILVIEPFCILPRDYTHKFVKDFKYIFTWAVKGFDHPALNKKLVEINHPSCLDLINKKHHGNDWLPWKERSDEIVFIANNKTSTHASELYSLRIKLADLLYKHSKYKVSWYGQIPLSKPYYKGVLKSKHRFLRKVKFSVCCENSYHSKYTFNYFTEKMPQVWGAGAVPIYMGCHNIDSFNFPWTSHIDLRKFVVKNENKKQFTVKTNKLISTIDSYSENQYNLYTNALKKNILRPNTLFHYISYDRMYNTILKKLS